MSSKFSDSDLTSTQEMQSTWPARTDYVRILQLERRALRRNRFQQVICRFLLFCGYHSLNEWKLDLMEERSYLLSAIEEHLSCLAAIDEHGYPEWGGFVVKQDQHSSK